MVRHAGFVFGMVGGLLSTLAWFHAVFGQTGRWESTEMRSDGSVISSQSGTTSLWESQDLHPLTMLFLVLLLFSAVCVMVGAFSRWRYGSTAGLMILWLSSIGLLSGSVVSAFSVGLWLIPGALLAFLAAAIMSIAVERDRRAVQR